MEQGKKTQKRSKGFVTTLTTLISLIALIFSGFSLYETVLKQPNIQLYKPQLIHLYRKGFKDMLVFPISLSNDGARRGTVLSFDLEVQNPATGENKSFQNIYFGSNPKDTSQIFSPISIAGRSSHSHSVIFIAEKAGTFFKSTGSVDLDLRLKLTLNLEQAEFWFPPKEKPTYEFRVTTNYIQSAQNMEKGIPTVLNVKK